MKTESVSIEMRMPECYSDMHDSEKGLTGGTSEKEASTGGANIELVLGGIGAMGLGGATACLGLAKGNAEAQQNAVPQNAPAGQNLASKVMIGVGAVMALGGLAAVLSQVSWGDS